MFNFPMRSISRLCVRLYEFLPGASTLLFFLHLPLSTPNLIGPVESLRIPGLFVVSLVSRICPWRAFLGGLLLSASQWGNVPFRHSPGTNITFLWFCKWRNSVESLLLRFFRDFGSQNLQHCPKLGPDIILATSLKVFSIS